MSKREKYSDQFKADAVELVITSKRPVAQVAPELGVNEGTLGNWVRQWKDEHPEADRDDRGPVEWVRHEAALAQIAELKRENEFLGKVSAFFAAKQR